MDFMNGWTSGFVLVIFSAMIAFAGCTGSSVIPGITLGTQSPTQVPVTGTITPGGTGSFVISPTDAMPGYEEVTITVGEKDYLGVIPVIFQGGLGQINVNRIDITLTRADGIVQIATLGTKKGAEVDLHGTRGSGNLEGNPDHVVVWVTMNSGEKFKVIDKVVLYRTRG